MDRLYRWKERKFAWKSVGMHINNINNTRAQSKLLERSYLIVWPLCNVLLFFFLVCIVIIAFCSPFFPLFSRYLLYNAINQKKTEPRESNFRSEKPENYQARRAELNWRGKNCFAQYKLALSCITSYAVLQNISIILIIIMFVCIRRLISRSYISTLEHFYFFVNSVHLHCIFFSLFARHASTEKLFRTRVMTRKIALFSYKNMIIKLKFSISFHLSLFFSFFFVSNRFLHLRLLHSHAFFGAKAFKFFNLCLPSKAPRTAIH